MFLSKICTKEEAIKEKKTRRALINEMKSNTYNNLVVL